MNNTIDHAILIPAYAKTIWRHLSNQEENTEWQTNCERITYLNSVRDGRGIRYRSYAKNRKESVIEITAWYPGLGYEYVIVDGFNYQNRGRIRLQEVAEGTVVQWTFNYETSGLMGSLSNSLSLKRKLSNEIIKNLQSLYQYIGQVAEKVDTNQIKSVMQEAPDAEDRAHYQPRYPSALDADEAGAARQIEPYEERITFTELSPDAQVSQQEPEPIATTSDDTLFQRPDPGQLINEPPLSDVDTKPNPSVQEADEKPVDQPIQTEEPETANDRDENRYIIPKPPFEPSDQVSELEEMEVEPSQPDDDESFNQVAVETELESTKPSITEQAEIPSVIAPETPVTTPADELKPSPAIDADNIFDTSQISVFDIFGLEKPSETQEVRAIIDSQITGSEVEELESESISQRGIGLRWAQRRQSVNIKLPH